MERICIYKNEAEIAKVSNWYKTVADRLQMIADALSNIEVKPTLAKIQALFDGGNLTSLVEESCNAQNISNMPRRVRELMIEDAEKAVSSIKEKAASLITQTNILVDWAFYQVNNGKVSLAPNYLKSVEESNSIYIDSDSRLIVYEKWLAMEKAIKEFNQAVKDAPKDNHIFENIARVNPNMASLYDADYLIGISTADHFSLALLDQDGTPTLKAQNFEYIR